MRRSLDFNGHRISLESVATRDSSQLAKVNKLRDADCFVITFNWTDKDHPKTLQDWVASCRAWSPRAVLVLLGNCLDKLALTNSDKPLKQLDKLMESLKIPIKNKAALPIPHYRRQEMVGNMVKSVILQIRKQEQEERVIFNPSNDPQWSFVVL